MEKKGSPEGPVEWRFFLCCVEQGDQGVGVSCKVY